LYWRLGPQMAIRHGDWKLVTYDRAADDGTRSGGSGVPRVTKPRLYNLATDIAEVHDQGAVQLQKAAELLTIWRAWNAEQARPLWQ
jgi:arylsulfatase A-like enzyme